MTTLSALAKRSRHGGWKACRYCAFTPDEVGVYATEAALVRIEGQGLREPLFHIGVHSPSARFPRLSGALAAYGTLDVGDPPNYEDRAIPHASAEAIEILEFWVREELHWHRAPRFEGMLVDTVTFNALRPDYTRLARARDRERWLALIESRDVSALADLLADVGCADPRLAARIVVVEQILDDARREAGSVMSGATGG